MAKVTNINLLPWREDKRQQRNRRFFGNCVFSALIAGVLAYLMVSHWDGKIENQKQRNTYLKGEITKLDSVISEIKTLKDKKEAIVERMNVIQQLQSNRTQVVHMFDDFVKKLPRGVYFDKLNKKGKSISMTGKAQSNGRVSDLMRNLDSSDWFDNASLDVVDLDDSDEIAVSKFNLKVAESLRDEEESETGL